MPGDQQQSLNNPQRLERLRRTQLLDGATAPILDRLTRIASKLLDVPVSLVSLVDNAGQHFPGLTGLGGWAGERRGTALSHSFCKHVVMSDAPLIIEDARTASEVADNLAIERLGVVAYAGVPLRTADGHTLGALCAIDSAPQKWTAEQVAILKDLAALAIVEIETHASEGATGEASNEELTSRDPMTGLLNGRGLLTHGESLCAATTNDTSPFSIVCFDVNDFGAFNDMFGFDRGNQRLREVGELLASVTPENGVLARVSVDEFVIVLAETHDAHCLDFVSAVRAALHERNAQQNLPALTLSIGHATARASTPMSFMQQLRNAEEQMYRVMDARKQSSSSAVAV